MRQQGKRKDQYKDAALGVFIGFIGIMIFCLVAVVWSEFIK